MPKANKHKRKIPVTISTPAAATSTSSSNPQATRTVIRRFHVLIKRKAQLEKGLKDGKLPHAQTREELAAIEEEIQDMGGLETYQRMSSIGQGNDRGGGSEKVLIGWLNELGERQRAHQEKRRLRLLEVGALKPDNYASCTTWIENTCIDLHSRHPDIKEQDFLLLEPDENREKWDMISLSLVVNFVPEPKDRGRMLQLAHTFLQRNGYLFLALPLPCILNSRYLTPDHLRTLMNHIGFEEIYSRWKEGGKMAYWLYKKRPSIPQTTLNAVKPFTKKVVMRTGNRNNFCILL
ncbi:hypothetical protein K474DRAFT_1659699 [Panus rudis PR-1116 ss-1]|nr:hypothetical protein K474DRAFT_1659699 [Panus rudis PR-1116 ss-1]